MARAGDELKVISANRLDTGAVVWLGADDRWVTRLAQAAVFDPAGSDLALARAQRDERAQLVVGVYGVAVTVDQGRPRAISPRERVRAEGPSVRPDLGLSA
jgi:hypothetical protein